MKNYKLLVLAMMLVLASNLSAQQYDDMYYDPERDKTTFDDYKVAKSDYRTTDRTENTSFTRVQENDRYDDEGYDYYDDYDYFYSSRIRRFHRPFFGFGFFDPVYVDMSYYDPFLSPGATVLIYDDVFAFNNWYRWNRWNNWGWNNWNNVGWNNWNTGWGFNSWNRWNNWGPSWYGFNSFGNGFYCPPTWGSNYVYNTVDNIRNNSYYGPRNTGSTRIPRESDREIRREAPSNDPRLTEPSSQGRIRPEARTRETENQPSDRERAHSERRREVEAQTREREITPRQSTERVRERNSNENNSSVRPRESAEPRTRSYEPPRSSTPQRESTNSGSSRSNNSDRSSGSSSSGPRSSGSSRRGGN